MSPLNINILLHVYAIAPDYRDSQLNMDHARSEAVRETFEWFDREGLILQITPDAEWQQRDRAERLSQYRVTAKGEAMVEALCAIQVPICKWVQP